MARKATWIVLVGLALAQAGRTASAEPLPTDPALVRGELPNGLRYVVRKHGHPPGRATVWMHVHSGSLNETDRQRGIAHYLEHMAFNGSENYPPGTLIPFFQSLGMTFGRDQNAFTNLEQTTYILSLPDAKPETLGKGMGYFADVLTRLLLSPKEIDAERQIILEERRRGLSGRQRVADLVRARVAPGSLWADRNTIGLEETILAFTEKDFRDYYGAWYAVSNATVLVVADQDPSLVVKAIGDAFGSAPKRPAPLQRESGVKAYDASFAIVASDPEIQSEELRITRLEPARGPATTTERWKDDLVLDLAESAFNRRLEDKACRGGTAYVSVRAGSGDDGRTMHSWEVTVRPSPGKWKAALEEAAIELQRARRFGFSDRELADVKKAQTARVEREVEVEATTPAQNLIRRMNSAVTTGAPMLSPKQEQDLLGKALPTITREDLHKRFAAEYDPKAVAFIAVLPAGKDLPTEAQVLEAGTKALAVEVTAEAEGERATQLMAEAPKPGKVVEGAEHTATAVWSGWLENGVRVHHRFMDVRRNEVTVEVALVGGELLETAADRGIASAAQVAWRTPATKSLASSDVRELMTGKKASVRAGGGAPGGGRGGRPRGGGMGVANPALSLTISGSPDDLESAFQLAYLLLTEPRIEPAAFAQFQTSARESIEEGRRNPLSLGMRTLSSAPFPSDDARFQALSAEAVGRWTLDAAQAWLEKRLADSPIEVTVVGDLPRERALDLVTRYLGALPARERVGPKTYEGLRTLSRPKGPRRIEATIDTPTPQAFVSSGFYGADETNRPDVRALNLAAQVLSTRMHSEIREKAQLVYSIGASSRTAATFKGFGTVSASSPTEPPKVDALVAKLAEVYAAFAKDGPTEDELAVAKKQAATTFEQQTREPDYWSTRLNLSTFRGTNLDEVAADPAAYQAITAAQVKETFARYATPENSIVVVVRPKSATPPGKPAGSGDPAPVK